MATITNEINNWLKSLFIGAAPVINHTFCHTGRFTAGLKSVITKDIEAILKSNKGKKYKFGKTGSAPTRADQDDYRSASYTTMFLLYKSSSKDSVSEFETYYSAKYHSKKRNDNIHTHSAGKMRSFNGYYFLYIVI